MKKILVCALAIAALASCQKNQVIETPSSPAIAFENAFVNNATRAAADPSYGENEGQTALSEISVYGFMNGVTGVVFDNERVAKDITNLELTSAWKYANTQYWTPGNTYYFAAVAPLVAENGSVSVDYSKANTNGVGVLSFTQPEDAGSVDVLYDAKVVTCESNAMNPVSFTMNHLLAKVKFSFTNGFGNDNAKITVSNIKMTAPAAGSINLARSDWWSTNQWLLGEGETVLAFGDMETSNLAKDAKTESQKERLTIPADAYQTYVVTFDVELFYGTQSAYKASLATEIKNAALEMGKAYNFHATIDASNIVPGDGDDDALKPIEFTATVKDWVDGNGYDGSVIETITPEAALKAAVAEGGSIALTEDVTLTEPLAISSNVTIDLAGNTITGQIQALENSNVILKNGTIANETQWAVVNRDAVVTLDGVTVNAIAGVWAADSDYDTVPSADATPASGIYVKDCTINVTGTESAGIYSKGYNNIVVENTKVNASFTALSATSAKIEIVNSSLKSTGSTGYSYGLYIGCCYVTYDDATTIVGPDNSDLYVYDYEEDTNDEWASYVNGVKATYGVSAL